MHEQARQAGWSASEIARATTAHGALPQVDFIAEAEQCQHCGGVLQIQKSKTRILSTVKTGTVQAREIRKCFALTPSHPVAVSERLAQLAPRQQR